MQKLDVSFEFYFNVFNSGQKGKISQKSFSGYISRAFRELDTFCSCNFDNDEKTKEKVKLCVCEIAELLYLSSDSGFVKSENIDGYSVTYSDSKEFEKELRRIVLKRLGNTGILFAGV